ncbi:MAG: PAS domain S-box protein [Hyphomicrobiaceae bacterium]|nr:PAS domain S-box protein [Hyphomicrobiaceae bacterium]
MTNDLDVASLGTWLAESSADCVKLIDLKGRISFINVAGAALLELDRAEAVVGARWVDSWPEDGRESVAAALDRALRGERVRFTGMYPTARGRRKWWDVVVTPLRNADGDVSQLLCVSRDISDMRRIQEQLQLRERQFRALADNMAQLAWMADGKGNVFWFNQRWFDYTGTTHADVAGWGWTGLSHPDHVERVVGKIRKHFESGEVWEEIFPLRGADGQYRWFLSRAMPLHDADGDVELWCGTHTDFTEQRNASARLRQKARLIELSHEAILVWSFETGIVSWNRGCEELYGFTRREAIGARSHELLRTRHPTDRSDFEKSLREYGSWTGEILHIAKDGTEVWVDSRQELIRADGRDLVLETNRDVSERRRAEHVRTLLLAELDHRVKNTLAIVQSIASQTARTSRDMRQFLTQFNFRLQALSSAHNLLAQTRWEGAEIHDLIGALLADAGLNDNPALTVEGPQIFLPAQIALQLSLIFFELATNAVKHGALSGPPAAGGRVRVQWTLARGDTDLMELRWQETGGPRVQLPSVRGFGMTLIERMGNQAHLKARTAFEADGLVCEISAKLQSQLVPTRGYFDPGHFRAAGPRRDPVPAARPATSPHGIRVLIIEDEPLIALAMEEMIHDAGLMALPPVGTLAEALAAVREARFEVAILDGNLNGEPVDTLVAELVERSLPYFFVTGFSRGSLPAGYDDVPIVRKPITEEALMAALRSVV